MSAGKMIAAASLLSGLQVAAALAAGPPRLDVTMTCDGAARMTGREKQGCLQDEHAAQKTLSQNWSKYRSDDRSRCAAMVQSGGAESYVELLSCLEAARDAKTSRGDGSIMTESDQSEPFMPAPRR